MVFKSITKVNKITFALSPGDTFIENLEKSFFC